MINYRRKLFYPPFSKISLRH